MTQTPQIQIVPPRELGPRTWGREILVAQGASYIGKVLIMRAGQAGGLQYHREKEETMILLAGEAVIESDDGHGRLTRRPLAIWESVHVPPGAPHRVRAQTTCLFIEFSSPHFDDRVRVEARYGEPDAGGLPTTPAPSSPHALDLPVSPS